MSTQNNYLLNRAIILCQRCFKDLREHPRYFVRCIWQDGSGNRHDFPLKDICNDDEGGAGLRLIAESVQFPCKLDLIKVDPDKNPETEGGIILPH